MSPTCARSFVARSEVSKFFSYMIIILTSYFIKLARLIGLNTSQIVFCFFFKFKIEFLDMSKKDIMNKILSLSVIWTKKIGFCNTAKASTMGKQIDTRTDEVKFARRGIVASSIYFLCLTYDRVSL